MPALALASVLASRQVPADPGECCLQAPTLGLTVLFPAGRSAACHPPLVRLRLRHILRASAAVLFAHRGAVSGVANVAMLLRPAVASSSRRVYHAQAAIVAAGMWGIAFFDEISGRGPLQTFVIGVALVLAGAVLLGIFG